MHLQAGGLRTLTSTSGNVKISAQTGGATVSGGSVVLKAGNGVNLLHSMTLASGSFAFLYGDTNGDGSGTVTVASGATLQTTDNMVKITAADVDLQGSLTCAGTSSTRSVVIQHSTTGEPVYLGTAGSSGVFSLTDAEINRISSAQLVVTGYQDSAEVSYGSVIVQGLTESSTTSFNDAAQAGVGGMVIEATAADKMVTFVGSNAAGCQIQASARKGIHIQGSLTTSGYKKNSAQQLVGLILIADSNADGTGVLTIASGQTVSSSGYYIELSAGGVQLDGSLTAVQSPRAGTTTIEPKQDGRQISLGSEVAGKLSLSGDELQRITTSGLTIGGLKAAHIVVDGLTSSHTQYITGAALLQVTQTSGDTTITFQGSSCYFKGSLIARAENGITVSTTVTTETSDLYLYGDYNKVLKTTDGIHIASGGSLVSGGTLLIESKYGQIDGTAGVTMSAKSHIYLHAAMAMTSGGSVVLNADSDADGTGKFCTFRRITNNAVPTTIKASLLVFKTSGTGSCESDVAVTYSDGSYTADANVAITSAALTVAPSQTGLALAPPTPSPPGTLDVSTTHLALFTAAGLTLGSTGTSTLSVANLVASGCTNGISSILTMMASNTNGAITFSNPYTSSYHALGVVAAGAVTLPTSLGSTLSSVGDVSLSGATLATGSGAALEVSSTRKITLTSTGGFTCGSHATFKSSAGILVASDLTVGSNGVLKLLPDTDNDGSGTLTVDSSKTVTAAANVFVTAADIDLDGAISVSSSGTLLVHNTGTSTTLGLGTATVSSGLKLDNNELSRITLSAGMILQTSTTSGSIETSGVLAADSDAISGVVTLIASQSSVTFSSTSSTFTALHAQAKCGVALQVSLSATTGGIMLDGDSSDGSCATANNGKVTMAADVTISSGAKLTLDGTTAGLTAAGAMTLKAATGVQLNDHLTGAGQSLYIDADSDGAGVGDVALTLAASKTITSGNGAIIITAGDIDLQGSIAAGSGQLTLMTKRSGTTIGLGATAKDCTVTGAELQRMTSTSGLVLGDKVRSGIVVVDGITAAQSNNLNTVTLKSYGATQLSTTRSYFKTVTIDSASSIEMGTGVFLDTSVGAMALTSQSATYANGAQLTSASTITMTVAGSGQTAVAAGALTLSATSVAEATVGVSIVNGMALSGILTVDTTGLFQVSGSDPISSNSDISVTASDVTLSTTSTALSISNNAKLKVYGKLQSYDLSLGVSPASADLHISSAELQKISSAGGIEYTGGSSAGADILVGKRVSFYIECYA